MLISPLCKVGEKYIGIQECYISTKNSREKMRIERNHKWTLEYCSHSNKHKRLFQTLFAKGPRTLRKMWYNNVI